MGEQSIDMTLNYFSSAAPLDSTQWFFPDTLIGFVPMDTMSNNPTLADINPTEEALWEAIDYEMDGDYEDAFDGYLTLIQLYPDSIQSMQALTEAGSCGPPY